MLRGRFASGKQPRAQHVEGSGTFVWPGVEATVTTSTIAQMSQSEFKEMLEAIIEAVVQQKLVEVLGDPDEGLEVRKAVQARLLRQKQAVAEGENGQPFENAVQRSGLD